MEYRIQRTEDYLAHHGVDGQKWGHRRYQNEDGSYKPGAEGRYDPDGQPGPNTGRKSGKLKNRLKSAAGIYKDGDGNPYVSERRREKRKTEEAEWNETKKKIRDTVQRGKEDVANLKAKRDKYHADKRAQEKAEWEAWQKREDEKTAAKQAKREAKLSKNSYKKIAGKYILRNIGATAAGALASKIVEKKTGSTGLGLYTNAAVQGIAKTANMIGSAKEAYDLHQYRKRKNSAQHSDISGYDELYHSETGGVYGIRRV